jgi:hypothetical protein
VRGLSSTRAGEIFVTNARAILGRLEVRVSMALRS